MRKYTTEEYISAFWSKVKIGNPDECWEWQGGKTASGGYGKYGSHKQNILAHRFSWELTNGKIPDSLFVLHKCDNPGCVNPNHLFVGTQQDNVTDRELKMRGNQPKGEKHGMARLSFSQVNEIRQRYASGTISQSELGKEYGVTQPMIGKIVRRENWK